VLNENNAGDVQSVGDAQLRFVVNDSVTSMTYQITGQLGPNNDNEPTATFDEIAYNSLLDGIELSEALSEETDVQVLKIKWGTDNITYVTNFFDNETNKSYIFALGGDELPDISSVSDFTALEDSLLSIKFPKNGPFAEGEDIALSSLPGVSISHHDKINGTGDRDVFSGGAGKDVIKGFGGRDWLRGDGGNDILSGGSGRDLLDGGKGNDKMTGGAGTDVFVFAKGYGKDKIVDFDDDTDVLKFNDNLWDGNLTAKQVVQTYASVSGDDIVFDFGKHELVLEDYSGRNPLFDDILIV